MRLAKRFTKSIQFIRLPASLCIVNAYDRCLVKISIVMNDGNNYVQWNRFIKQKATINHIHVISTFTYVVRVLEFVLEAERKTHLQFLISLFRKKQFREKKTHTQRHGHCSSVSLNNAAFCMTFLTTRIEPTWSINIWIVSLDLYFISPSAVAFVNNIHKSDWKYRPMSISRISLSIRRPCRLLSNNCNNVAPCWVCPT